MWIFFSIHVILFKIHVILKVETFVGGKEDRVCVSGMCHTETAEEVVEWKRGVLTSGRYVMHLPRGHPSPEGPWVWQKAHGQEERGWGSSPRLPTLH